MSFWTEVVGIIYIDDWSGIDGSPKVDLVKAVRKGLPVGSEGELAVAVNESDNEYKAISIFGAVRDMEAYKFHEFTDWWNNLQLGDHVRILMASIRLTCEGLDVTLKEREYT